MVAARSAARHRPRTSRTRIRRRNVPSDTAAAHLAASPSRRGQSGSAVSSQFVGWRSLWCAVRAGRREIERRCRRHWRPEHPTAAGDVRQRIHDFDLHVEIVPYDREPTLLSPKALP